MALIVAGTGIGQASGKLGSLVFSHNRGGAYVRARSMPTQPGGHYQDKIRAAVEVASKAWRGLTAEARAAWTTWADGHPLPNRVGQMIRLQGNAAYVQLNARLIFNDFANVVAVPPAADPPDALLSLGGHFDVGAGAFDVSYLPTPLGATEHVYVWGALYQDPSIKYVKNRLRLVCVSDAAQAQPYNVKAAFQARFGLPKVGNGVTFVVCVFDSTTGLISVPQRVDGVVVST